jgi:protein O-GlcNAc transferase
LLSPIRFFSQALVNSCYVCNTEVRSHILNFQEQGRIQEAISSFRQTLILNPEYVAVKAQMLHQLQQICSWENVETIMQELRTAVRETAPTQQNRLPPFSFLSMPGGTSEEQRICAEKFAIIEFQALISQRKKLNFEFNRVQGKKISVGYLSADFKQHALSILMAQVFELHDRSRFHITAYSYGKNDGSEMRARLEKAFDEFVDIQHMTDESAAKKIYADGIDILVDLTGYTLSSRSSILALRPAPIQVNYLGYPGTMGVDFVDYLIADRFTIPPEKRESYSENVVWMPDCFQANDSTRCRPAAPSRKDCGLPEDVIVFCCFNQPAKINPEMFDIWCRLLKAVPDSVLWMFASNPLVVANLSREAANRGIAQERLVMAPLLSYEEHLARLQCADLFLDTLPFNAGTTCSDALWMGLPVVTCSGDAFASRMAGSLLNALGVPELVTYNLEDYFSLILSLATDKKKLEVIQNRIIACRDKAPLFNSVLFTRNLEAAYSQMVKELPKV